MENQKFLLGLDIGTNSVGWCLTDERYDIVKKNGKSLWGVRMFEEAESAMDRRGFRTMRRNIAKRKKRVELLQMLFAEEIHHIDPTFFKRLEESFYQMEDRHSRNKHTLFIDKWNDYDYFKKFPTIYHLRKELIEKDEKADIRLIYLALSQMMKKRGHFLNEVDDYNVANNDDVVKYLESFKENINTFFENIYPNNKDVVVGVNVDDVLIASLRGIFNESSGMKIKKAELNNLFNTTNNKVLKDFIIPFLVGSKINLQKIDGLCLNGKKDIEVNMEDFENVMEEIKSNIEFPELIDALKALKMIYDFYYLDKLLSNGKYLYQAMIEKYDNHKSDLKLLKTFIKKYHPSVYYKCFREIDSKGKLHNYPSYVGMNETTNKTTRFNKCSKIDFYKFLKSIVLDNYDKCEESDSIVRDIIQKIEEGKFLNKLATTDNSIFPYQLNLRELKIILSNQAKYHPFLNNVVDGYSVAEKIELIFKHKTPYYVGPLNKNSKNSWAVRTNQKIYPWNFDEVVDIPKSAEAFIKRMLNKCTYLKDCYCMSKNSILFSKYNMYSYINKLSINGLPINESQKQGLMQNVFLKIRKPSKKDLISYFKSFDKDVIITTSTEKEIENITCNMASYYDFCKIFGDKFVVENIDIIDKLIEDITIFKDKKILEKRILSEERYSVFRTHISKIKGLNYDGFASISRELLNNLIYIDENGEVLKIIDIMEKTNLNLQEIIFSKRFNYEEKIIEYNEARSINCDNVEDFIESEIYVSPIMKRPLLQAYHIIDELEKIVGSPISEYYIECTRTNRKEKNPNKSRKETVLDLLKHAQKESMLEARKREVNELISRCEREDESSFRSDKIYLYYTQLGKCMYTLRPIDFSLLNNDNLYDVDHIVPQALIKDDSINNKVLTIKEVNIQKGDQYPIPTEILNANCNSFYRLLLNAKLIEEKKFSNLTKRELSDSDINRFINRQIVATNQAVKGLVDVLNIFKKVDKRNIIYSKAENISDIRQKYQLVKSRLANNFHHAHDAYLNIVIGRAIHKYFTRFNMDNMKDIKLYKYKGITVNPDKIFDLNREIKMPNFDKLWSREILDKVIKNIYNRFDILTTTRTYYSNKLLSKVTIKPASDSDSLTAVKTSNPILAQVNKYGGFSDESFSCYSLVKYLDKKEKTIYQIVAIPNRYINEISTYINSKVTGMDIEVIIEKLKINTVILRKGRKFCITGKNGNTYVIKNLQERFFNKDIIAIVNKIEKYYKNKEYNIPMLLCGDDKLIISAARSKTNREIVITNEELLTLFIVIKEIFSKDVYAYSNIISINNNLNQAKFIEQGIVNKIFILKELLGLLKCNERKVVDLSDLGLSTNTGILTINNKMEKGDKILYESITGFYNKVAWELK